MDLKGILEEWEKESEIDEFNLDSASLKSARLHAKYLSKLSNAKLTLRGKEMDFERLKKDKWEWFAGRMSKDEMDARGWSYDPFEGASKPKLKENMQMFYDADKDLYTARSIIEYYKVLVDTLVDILDNIKWRHQNIRNVIEWKKFVSGD